MSRIESLAILATDKGNDFLAEKYGVVIDNIATGTISAQLKNKDLSGDPTTGSVEAKRFCNSKSNPYGTPYTYLWLYNPKCNCESWR